MNTRKIFKNISFLFIIRVYVCGYAHVCAIAMGARKRAQNHLGLAFQAIVSCLVGSW